MKPKGKDIVGWSTMKTYATNISVLAEKDVDQRKRRKAGEYQTWSAGHIVRQLGVAKFEHPSGYYLEQPTTYFIYTHSSTSNGSRNMYRPPAFVGINKEDAAWLVTVLLLAGVMDDDKA